MTCHCPKDHLSIISQQSIGFSKCSLNTGSVTALKLIPPIHMQRRISLVFVLVSVFSLNKQWCKMRTRICRWEKSDLLTIFVRKRSIYSKTHLNNVNFRHSGNVNICVVRTHPMNVFFSSHTAHSATPKTLCGQPSAVSTETCPKKRQQNRKLQIYFK